MKTYELAEMTREDAVHVATHMDEGCVRERDALLGHGWSRDALVDALIETAGIAYAVRMDERPVCCAGVQFQHSGLGVTWLFHVERTEIDARGFVLIRARCRVAIDALLAEGVLHRIECLSALPHGVLTRQFLEGMGLIEESARPWYGIHRENFTMFARLAEG